MTYLWTTISKNTHMKRTTIFRRSLQIQHLGCMIACSTLPAVHAEIDEVFDFLTGYEGEDLQTMLKGATQFSRISNPTDRTTRIANKMTEALERIADMSEINARRLKRFGITPNPDG